MLLCFWRILFKTASKLPDRTRGCIPNPLDTSASNSSSWYHKTPQIFCSFGQLFPSISIDHIKPTLLAYIKTFLSLHAQRIWLAKPSSPVLIFNTKSYGCHKTKHLRSKAKQTFILLCRITIWPRHQRYVLWSKPSVSLWAGTCITCIIQRQPSAFFLRAVVSAQGRSSGSRILGVMAVTTMHGAAREVSDPTFAAHFEIAVRINAIVPMNASTFFLEVTTQVCSVNFKSFFLWSCQHCRGHITGYTFVVDPSTSASRNDAYCRVCQYTAVKFNPPVGDIFMVNFAGRKYSTLMLI